MDEDLRVLYAAVAARRTSFDTLVWQVPVLSLTAQAFLFTIALGPESSRAARSISALLAIVITLLSIMLMARHRQAEIADAHWLEETEQQFGIPVDQQAHGSNWKLRRDQVEDVRVLGIARVPTLPGYQTWVVGLAVFGLAAVAILVMAALAPEILSSQPTRIRHR